MILFMNWQKTIGLILSLKGFLLPSMSHAVLPLQKVYLLLLMSWAVWTSFCGNNRRYLASSTLRNCAHCVLSVIIRTSFTYPVTGLVSGSLWLTTFWQSHTTCLCLLPPFVKCWRSSPFFSFVFHFFFCLILVPAGLPLHGTAI